MAEVLARRGTRATLFRGSDGLDELTTTGPSTVLEVVDGVVRESAFEPADVGLPPADPDDLLGGDVETAVSIARSVLDGTTGPRRDVVLVNAAVALAAAGAADSIASGLEVAVRSVDSGRAAASLERWVRASRREDANQPGDG
jgi:anthranilate phosphoribosyltransferase